MARDNIYDIDINLGEYRFDDYMLPASEPTKFWNVNRSIESGRKKFASYFYTDS